MGAMDITDYKYKIKSYGIHETVIIYPTMSDNGSELEQLHRRSGEISGNFDYALVAVEVSDWNSDLSPWKFVDEEHHKNFPGNGESFLHWLIDCLVPKLCEELQIEKENTKWVLGGYSMGGLFSLWSAYKTDFFTKIVSCSGSLWYADFMEYCLKHEVKPACDIYISLGRKEEKTRDIYMKEVGNATRRIYQHLQKDVKVKGLMLEWNPGNHFKDVQERMAKGFAWALM